MKNLINNILGISLVLLLLASCEKKEFVRPTIELELFSDVVQLNLNSTELTSATVKVKHGNSGYTVESSDETVVTVSNVGVEITVTAVSEGTATVTVTDSKGKTAYIDVTVAVTAPTTPTFTWNGQSVAFDIAGGYGITVLSNKIALTDIVNDQKQYILSWAGGFSGGEKTDATLTIISAGSEPQVNELSILKVLKSEESGYYIVFSDGVSGGELFFSR